MNIIIFGTNPTSKLLKYYIEEDSADTVVAFTLDKKYITQPDFCDRPVIPFEELETHYKKDDIRILITIGYGNMNDIRKSVYEKCKEKHYHIQEFIHSTVDTSCFERGEGNIILPHVFIGAFSKIGNCNIFNSHSILGHESSVGNYNFFAGRAGTAGLCTLGNNNFLGACSFLTDQIAIGTYNLIGASCCITKNISDYTVISAPTCRMKQTVKKNIDTLINGNI